MALFILCIMRITTLFKCICVWFYVYTGVNYRNNQQEPGSVSMCVRTHRMAPAGRCSDRYKLLHHRVLRSLPRPTPQFHTKQDSSAACPLPNWCTIPVQTRMSRQGQTPLSWHTCTGYPSCPVGSCRRPLVFRSLLKDGR